MTRKSKYIWLTVAGAAVATLIVCFSLFWPPVSRTKVQGAIGQRDVYRQTQLTDEDVGVAGQAQVTIDDVTALLNSPEFKTLAKDPQFQKMLAEGRIDDLNNLMNQARRRAQEQGAQTDELIRRRAQEQGAQTDELIRRRAQEQGAQMDEARRRAQADEARRRLGPDSQAALTALANNAQLSAALSAVAGSQALRRLAESGSLQQATLAGAVQNSVLQSLASDLRPIKR